MRTWNHLSWILPTVYVGITLLPATAFAKKHKGKGSAGVTPIAYTVPWVPSDPSTPHITYPGRTITLKGTSSVAGPTIMATWDPGDGSPLIGPFNVSNQYNASATYAYPENPGPTVYIATLSITDTSPGGGTGTATYPVVIQAEGGQPQVDVAIDEGLWYLHTIMYRYQNTPGTSDGLSYGDWYSCSGFACDPYPAITGTNVTAFEVNGHLQNGPATDPYTDDVYRAMNSIFNLWLSTEALPLNRTVVGTPAGNLTYTIDEAGTGTGVSLVGGSTASYNNYELGQLTDAIVATGTPNATAPAQAPTGIANQTYAVLVQEIVDDYVNDAQYNDNALGGAWYYQNCSGCEANDNSASQWAAIGIIAATRGFGAKIDPNFQLWNGVWVSPGVSQNTNGEFGYMSVNPIWVPWADTPSGLVQLAMDGVGRGDSRWDAAECFLFDNFEIGNATSTCGQPDNPPCVGAGESVQAYTYGMYSFTKAMLLNNPGGSLQPITLLGQQCPNPGYAPIDWYGDPEYGVATTLINLQNPAGYWYGNNFSGEQYPLETGSSIIMLQKTVFVQCVTNLFGKGKPSGSSPARVDLVWSAIPNVKQYNVLRGTQSGGPYSLIGSTSNVVYTDTNGLVNGKTYYYVLQPQGSEGTEICQSNQAIAAVPIPQ